MLAGGDVEGAVAALEDAVRLAPGAVLARVDLSAAFVERWRRTNEATHAIRALDEAERARQLQPRLAEAQFNHALVLEALGMHDEARRAWRAYLALDSASGWAAEARQRLEKTGALPDAAGAVVVLTTRSDADLDALADADPLVLYRYLERRALPEWADSVMAGRRPNQTQALRAVRALVAAGRDRYLVDLVGFAQALPARADDARLSLAKAIVTLDRWWDLYDATEYAESRTAAVEARQLLERAGAPTIDVDLRLSLIDVGSGRTADGLARLPALEAVARARHYYRILAVSSHLRGLASMQKTSVDDAVRSYQAALEFSESAGDTELSALSHAYLATARATQGDRAAAWAHLVECARRLPAMRIARRRYQFYSRAAGLAQDAGLSGVGLVISDALLNDPVETRLPWPRFAGHLLRARARSALGAQAAAQADLDAAFVLANGVKDPTFRRESLAEVAITTGQILATTDPARAAVALTEGLAFQQVRANQFRTASLLLARGRVYSRSGELRRAEADWMEGVELLEDTRLSIRDAQLRIARTADTWDLFEELVGVQRDRPLLALETVERTHARELLDSIAPGIDLGRFARSQDYSWLPADSTALVYSAGADRLLIWVVTARAVTLWERPVSLETLKTLVEASVRSVQSGLEAAPVLSAALLPEGLDVSAVTKLIIVPDGPLHQLPFAMLRDPNTKARLVDTTIVTVSPSLSILRALHERPGPTRLTNALLVGAGQANVQEGLAALPGVSEELGNLRRLYPAASILAGADATAEALLRRLRQADLLHFAGHAISDSVHPARSRLLMSPTATLTALRPADIAASRMRSGGLVVLGACDTAAGQAFKGEGALNLARPFLVAGASSVVAALWPIADREASRFLLAFHARLVTGMAPAAALTAVQRQSDKASQSTWAAFVLIGRG